MISRKEFAVSVYRYAPVLKRKRGELSRRYIYQVLSAVMNIAVSEEDFVFSGLYSACCYISADLKGIDFFLLPEAVSGDYPAVVSVLDIRHQPICNIWPFICAVSCKMVCNYTFIS